MAYMVMLVVHSSTPLDDVIEAWQQIPVDQVILLDSTCCQAEALHRPHIPMRFVFGLVQGHEASTRTLFAIVPDEGVVQQCIEQAESVLGPLAAAPNALLAAWPLPIVHGYPKAEPNQGSHP